MAVANALAYNDTATITVVKSLIVQAPAASSQLYALKYDRNIWPFKLQILLAETGDNLIKPFSQ
jgi:hypothetical protein